jgi:PAS domain S-box-containing protein
MRTLHEYAAAAIVDRSGTIRFAVGAASGLDPDVVRSVAGRALAAGRPLLSDVHRHDVRDDYHLNLVAPIARPGGELVGAVVLRLDPYRYLYRMLEAWPGPSASAETVLVRADGAKAAVLNELRHRHDDPATLAIALDSDDPVARAAAGARGVLEGDDYRGRRVLAAALAIPDSTWTLVAKVDQDEAFALLAERRVWVLISVAALVVAAAFAAWLWWRAQAERVERQRFRDEAERNVLARRLEHLAKSALDMVIVADERSRIVEVNDRAAELLGYPRDALLGMEVRALRDPATIADYDARVAQEIAEGAIAFETRYRRRDGTTFPVELSVRSD